MTNTPEVKTIKMNLRVNLTDEEKLDAGKELAEATNSLEELENDKARVTSDFKAKITAIAAEVGILSNKLRSGYEFRDVECRVEMDNPEPGMKSTFRNDTDEKLRSDAMTEEEKQLQLGV